MLSEEGSFPLRSHVLHVGIRFPLGVASAGLAILSHLPAWDVDDYFSRRRLDLGWGAEHSEEAVRKRIELTRTTGYAVNPALIVEGSWGIGRRCLRPQRKAGVGTEPHRSRDPFPT